jgi:phosphoribosylanthranilate isomerase
MIVQIYETSTPEEAQALVEIGVDHIGVLVGDGSFPREHSIEHAREILSAVPTHSKGSVLMLSSNVSLIEGIARELTPAILHLGASTDLLKPHDISALKERLQPLTIMRSIPVIDETSVAIAKSYQDIADILLLDSHRPDDTQIGALGVTHSWALDKIIVQSVRIPVIMAGGLGPHNVTDAINMAHPAGVDSKTKTDKAGSHSKDLTKVKRFAALAKSCTPCEQLGPHDSAALSHAVCSIDR